MIVAAATLMKRIAVVLLMLVGASLPAMAGTPQNHIQISLESGTHAEQTTANIVRTLLEAHDLTPWLFTRELRIETGVIPHSHPVLTLNTRYNNAPDRLLTTLLHEQIHYWIDAHRAQMDEAVRELQQQFPRLPTGYPDGAVSRRSSYEHLVVNYLERESLKRLLGESRSKVVADYLEQDHYRSLYRQVRVSRDEIGQIIQDHDLLCCGLERE